jgi:hypothetical protein
MTSKLTRATADQKLRGMLPKLKGDFKPLEEMLRSIEAESDKKIQIGAAVFRRNYGVGGEPETLVSMEKEYGFTSSQLGKWRRNVEKILKRKWGK